MSKSNMKCDVAGARNCTPTEIMGFTTRHYEGSSKIMLGRVI